MRHQPKPTSVPIAIPREADLAAAEAAQVHRLVSLYLGGWFPMGFDGRDGVDWVQPHARALIPLDIGAFHIPRSLAQRVRSARFLVTADTAFPQVLQECSQPRVIEGELERETWLRPEILSWYLLLHRAGLAHSVEAWLPGEGGRLILAGGLYGIALGGTFCGESMFSRPHSGGTDASKVCLVHLVGHLRSSGFAMLDSQIANQHIERFGTLELPQIDYIRRLRDHLTTGQGWTPFDASAALAAMPELKPRG